MYCIVTCKILPVHVIPSCAIVNNSQPASHLNKITCVAPTTSTGMENAPMTMLGPNPKEGAPGVDELVEVLEEPLAPSDDLIFSDN